MTKLAIVLWTIPFIVLCGLILFLAIALLDVKGPIL